MPQLKFIKLLVISGDSIYVHLLYMEYILLMVKMQRTNTYGLGIYLKKLFTKVYEYKPGYRFTYIYIYVYVHTDTHTQIYIYIYVCVYILFFLSDSNSSGNSKRFSLLHKY